MASNRRQSSAADGEPNVRKVLRSAFVSLPRTTRFEKKVDLLFGMRIVPLGWMELDDFQSRQLGKDMKIGHAA